MAAGMGKKCRALNLNDTLSALHKFCHRACDGICHRRLFPARNLVRMRRTSAAIRSAFQSDRIPVLLRDSLFFLDLKEGEPGRYRPGSYREGQLKERSEGVQAQWQTALGEVLAAGS